MALDNPMLGQLLQLLENKENGLSLSEISRAMNAQPTAVLAMIAHLVQKGKLLEIGPDGGHCASCGLISDCNLLAARGKRYVRAELRRGKSISSCVAPIE